MSDKKEATRIAGAYLVSAQLLERGLRVRLRAHHRVALAVVCAQAGLEHERVAGMGLRHGLDVLHRAHGLE